MRTDRCLGLFFYTVMQWQELEMCHILSCFVTSSSIFKKLSYLVSRFVMKPAERKMLVMWCFALFCTTYIHVSTHCWVTLESVLNVKQSWVSTFISYFCFSPCVKTLYPYKFILSWWGDPGDWYIRHTDLTRFIKITAVHLTLSMNSWSLVCVCVVHAAPQAPTPGSRNGNRDAPPPPPPYRGHSSDSRGNKPPPPPSSSSISSSSSRTPAGPPPPPPPVRNGYSSSSSSKSIIGECEETASATSPSFSTVDNC